MNGATPKLGRRSPAEAPTNNPSPAPAPKKKKKNSPRNPLKDINTAAVARSSADAQRGGCLRFLLSGSSSRDPVPRSLSRTPKSAPPNPRPPPSKTSVPSKLRPLRVSDKPATENSKSKKWPKPKTPYLLHGLNGRKPSSETKSAGKKSSTDLSSGVVGFDRNGRRASTPEKTVPEFDGPETTKEAEKKLSTTPSSAATPPIKASISPEMLNSSLLAPTPICFAAGHVIAGVQDRRKCRPRGILTIGEALSEDGTAAPPLAEASMKWLSSPSEIARGGTSGSSRSRSSARTVRYGDEASVKWLLSSPGGDQDGSFHSPEFETPSTGCGLRQTPTSCSSTSPFSAILQQAAASSGLTNVGARQERGRYRYGCIAEDSRLSGGSSAMMPSFELDSVTEVLGSISLSPRPLPFTSEASFQFRCPAAHSNSIDKSTEMRISWRKGLVSRMFEMEELGRSPWMRDDEGESKAGSMFEFKADTKNSSSESKEGDEQLVHVFGSVELACGDNGGQRGKGKNPATVPISCAESISTEGDGGLISSGDSDWTLFYKNRLFES